MRRELVIQKKNIMRKKNCEDKINVMKKKQNYELENLEIKLFMKNIV